MSDMQRNLLGIGIVILLTGMVLTGFGAAGIGPFSVPAATAEVVASQETSGPVRIIHPVANTRLPSQYVSTYVCGSVALKGKLFINGTEVPVHPDGGFLTMVNLKPGQFVIKAELKVGEKTYTESRSVEVDGPEQAAPVEPLTIESLSPLQDQELLPGEEVKVICKGSPGVKAYFTIKGSKKKYPLNELPQEPGGIYQGVYRLDANELKAQRPILVTLTGSKKGKLTRETPGKVGVFPMDAPVMAEVIAPNTIMRSGPALGPEDKAGYAMFPPEGTVVRITGRKGNEYRVGLTATKTVWASIEQLKLLPKGVLDSPVAIGDISIRPEGEATRIKIPLERKVPFAIEADGEGRYLDVLIYGAYSNTDRIYNASSQIVQQAKWFQESAEIYRLRVMTPANSWWGYNTGFDGNALVIDLRVPPPAVTGRSALEGLTIAVDAGHGAGGGATGCTGYAEGDINYAMALDLKSQLLAKGAKVVLVRPGAEDVPLADRPKIALQNQADILVSLHNNSAGYGDNPLEKHGYEIYYFTPMSLRLAREIHTAYSEAFQEKREFTLPDNGLNYGNLALARLPQIPSVLIESAYMIVPQEEAFLKNPRFRAACSQAIVAGLERYAAKMRNPGKTNSTEWPK